MSTGKRAFLTTRLDELVLDLEADAPSHPPQDPPGAPTGPLVTAQRHRAEVDTADDHRVDEILRAHPDIAHAWANR
ncbi:hypothetical protein B2J88_18880 [Rhodococcus sp. SRB_17]|uniref:hypothetical protein n=1 Tax=Rhodococcus sp. OK302 TaxID=1882769 RepID=UPI000B942F3F|nr:hypothetical protein [Rhodococcus sp. OK302]NMM86402.1 hypothetical protein [Rhodococcus sp. SRB_17]OYD69699.1 hypothetical protein BDB13_3272 [Rhodococcus sp. OK302]